MKEFFYASMTYNINTFTHIWLETHHIIVEADSNKSLPTIEIIGLPDASIKESKERIRAALRNVGIQLPPRKIILNLAPSHIKKVWTRFDVALAVAVLCLIYEPNQNEYIKNSLFFWELWLSWNIKPIKGTITSLIWGMKNWRKKYFIPIDNIKEVSHIPEVEIYWISHINDIINIFQNSQKILDLKVDTTSYIHKIIQKEDKIDEIKWHSFAKNALAIAAAWMHNILMNGPPWSGKSMLAKATQELLPPLTRKQILEVSSIYSVIWRLSREQPLITERPFRTVHHTTTKVALVWWGRQLNPWEISLAHHGILFLDELPEFKRENLEVLRQPIEEKKVYISRATWTVCYPASCMIIAAMNPCKCWFFTDKEKQCTCSVNAVVRYQSKISWPLIDRFDMILEIQKENAETLLSKSDIWPTYHKLKEKIDKARKIQKKRYKDTNISSNSELFGKEIHHYIHLQNEAEIILKKVVKQLHLSPRVIMKTLKLSRTIADTKEHKKVSKGDIIQALQYRKSALVK